MRKNSCYTDDETICATIMPSSQRGCLTQRDRGLEENKSIEDINATQSINADYSQLLSQKQYPQKQAEQYSFKTSPRYS